MIQPLFNTKLKTALFIGKYQPFDASHKAQIEEGIRKHGQVCIGVRDYSPEWPFDRVRNRIEVALAAWRGKFIVIPLPNITAVCYG